MKKHFTRRDTAAFLIVGALVLTSAGTVSFAMEAAQVSADKEVVNSVVEQWEAPDYELPISDNATGVYDNYQGPITIGLMPIDLSLTKADVPFLSEKLSNSDYLAVYLDNEICLRVTKDAIIQVSNDSGTTWADCNINTAAPEDFAAWLLEHDPNPGYSMKETQARLKGDAEVKHLVFEDGVKEMYFVIDSDGVQIELVQAEKIASVLIDGKRMMITTTQISYVISDDMLDAFYDLLVDNGVLVETEFEDVNAEVMPWVEDVSN